jgi:hypothetical protein
MNDMSALNAAFYEIGCACEHFAKAISNLATMVVSSIPPYFETYLAENKRVKHLALYGTKARTRKKNFNRIQKDMRINEHCKNRLEWRKR